MSSEKTLTYLLQHPEISRIVTSLNMNSEEVKKHQELLLEVLDYFEGRQPNLKILYRGVGGSIFWSWAPKIYSEENVWLTEISQLEKALSFQNFQWERVTSQALLELVRDFTNTLRAGKKPSIYNVYIHGPTNTHKTVVTKALLNFAKTSHSVAFVNVVELQERIIGLDYSEIKSIVNAAKNVEILTLDDIGAENVGDFFRDSVLYKIIVSRNQQSLPTFYTSSFSLELLEKVQNGNKPSFYTNQKAKKLIDQIVKNCHIIDTSLNRVEEF